MDAFYVSSADTAEKRGFWGRTIDQTFGAVDMKIADESTFFGEIRSAPLGSVDFAEVTCDNELAIRTRRHIAFDKAESFILILSRKGRLQIGQVGRECELAPDMFALFDLNTPYTYCHRERTEVLVVVIPGSLFRSRMRDPLAMVARPYSAINGVGRVTADLLTSLAREVQALPAWAAQGYCTRAVDLIGVLFEAADDDLPIANSAVRSALYRRCVAMIETHLADRALDPAKIAELTGISVRYLHQIFQDAGESVGNYVRLRRLDRCHRDLSDPSKRNVPIGEIACRAGFHSPSHFTNSFKRQYGLSPRDIRGIHQE